MRTYNLAFIKKKIASSNQYQSQCKFANAFDRKRHQTKKKNGSNQQMYDMYASLFYFSMYLVVTTRQILVETIQN